MTATQHETKTVEPFVGPLPDPDTPVAVEVDGTVDVRQRPNRRWVPVIGVANSAEASRIISAQRDRVTLVLVNNGSATAYLGADRGVNASMGFPVAPGASVSMLHQGAVWFVSPTATQAAQQVVNGFAEIETE